MLRVCVGFRSSASPLSLARDFDDSSAFQRSTASTWSTISSTRRLRFQPVEPAGAEFAAVGAADLRGDAERVAVARLAVERRVRRDQHAFDERMVAQPPEEFLRGVARALFANQFERGSE